MISASVSYTHLDVYKRQAQNETGTQIFVTVADGCPYRTVGRSIVDVYSSQGNIFRIHIAGHRNAVGLFIVMQVNLSLIHI